jgi:hypothetical protein
MPTKVRIQAEHRRPPVRRVPIAPERLIAALQVAGLSQRSAAQKLGLTAQRFQHYVKRRVVGRMKDSRPRAPANVRRELARLTGVPVEWLAGEMRALPGARDRWEDLQWAAWPTMRSLAAGLSALGRPSSDNSHSPTDAVLEQVRRDLTTLRGLLDQSLPRHLRSVPPPDSVLAFRSVLDELAAGVRSHPIRSEIVSAARAKVSVLLRGWPVHPGEHPSLAQVIEHRLLSGCWLAWVRDAKTRFPKFDPLSGPTPVQKTVNSTEIHYAAPWPEWFWLQGRMWQLLSLRHWRGESIGAGYGTAETEEELAAIPVLGRALGAILQPWIEGRTSGIPRLLEDR